MPVLSKGDSSAPRAVLSLAQALEVAQVRSSGPARARSVEPSWGHDSGTARRIPRRASRRGCTILATHALATPAAATDTMVGVTTSAPTAATGTGVAGAHATIVASHGTLIASGRVGSARVNG